MRRWAFVGACAASALLAACDWFGGRSCSSIACIGPPTKLEFVDEDGQPVGAKGELRDAEGTHAFDCADAPSNFPFDVSCSDGTLSKRAPDAVRSTNEVRFVKDDGSLSDWQPFVITATQHSQGDECPCSWFEGETKPLLVPTEARHPLRQPLLNVGGASADP